MLNCAERMKNHHQLFALGLAASLSVFGAGCFKSSTPVPITQKTPAPATQKTTKPAQPSSNPPVISFGTDNVANTTINNELTQILKNFAETKSFRTSFSIPSSQGTVSTTMDFIRPNRFRGTMNIGSMNAEIVVVDQNVYMRTTASKWSDLSGSDMAKPVTDTLKNAMGGNNSLDKMIVDPNTVVKKEQDTSRNCTQYTAVVRSAQGAPSTLNICAVDQLPKYVDITSDSGKVSFLYYDYNALFMIERPM
jgi:hypothetical protein